ncbi:MAG TPA: hypothetical protein VM432_05805 [Bdellovibrionales bacterium]|nr:hypothetical protein [Bdellovibrionales bacterium]
MKALNAGMRVFVSCLLVAGGASAFADSSVDVGGHSAELCEGFFPKDFKVKSKKSRGRFLSARQVEPVGLTEAEFNTVIDKIESIYTPIFAQLGSPLVVERDWASDDQNAYAFKRLAQSGLLFRGGLPRIPGMTKDAFMGVACHEVGHHLGGLLPASGLTNEGGADYFATLKCLRLVFGDEDNAAIVAASTVDPVAKQRCEESFASDADRLICQRSSVLSQVLGGFLAGDEAPPKLDTPDTTVVTRTNSGHPAAQCRLDTYFAGSTCTVAHDIALSKTDYREGACVEGTHTVGFRPKCWFKAPEAFRRVRVLRLSSISH